MALDLDRRFPRYTEFDPLVPVWCITPDEGGFIHRFFDTSPISPSGRFVALTRLPFEDRLPEPGDVAEVVLVDLETGERRVAAETRGWDTQLGAQAQWGPDDSQLFFNNVDASQWRPFGVMLDPQTGKRKELDGTVYMVSPDGSRVASPCLRRAPLTQAGYGVVLADEHVPRNSGAPDDDGLFVTDTTSGESRLLASLKDIVEVGGEHFKWDGVEEGDFYGFHVKWNLQGTRLMFVVRWLPEDPEVRMRPTLVTMNADGSDIHVAVPNSEWGKGGHHPNWHPDGEHVMMNLKLDGETLRFVKARYDGTGLVSMTDAVLGSGHPSMRPGGRYIVTDAYVNEPIAAGDGTIPIRLVDIEKGGEKTLVRINRLPPNEGPNHELRVDPHPAWDFEFKRIAFNGCPDGVRRVFIADLRSVLE